VTLDSLHTLIMWWGCL